VLCVEKIGTAEKINFIDDTSWNLYYIVSSIDGVNNKFFLISVTTILLSKKLLKNGFIG